MKASEIISELNKAIGKFGDLEVMCEEYGIIRVSEELNKDYFGESYIFLEGIC